MKKAMLISLIFLSLGCKSQNSEMLEDTNILFIGNSLTYYHDMPHTLQKMLNETNGNIKISQSTFPGMSLTWHLENIIETETKENVNTRKKISGEKTKTEKIIQEKKWDIIVLQDGTVRFLIPESRELDINKAINQIKKLVDNPNCQFFLFSTWPSKTDYPKEYCYSGFMIDESLNKNQKYCSPKIENYDQEVKLIKEAYKAVAIQNGIKETNNANIFHIVNKKYPELTLLEDPIHPSKIGAFLNACVFYEILTSNKAKDLKYTGDINPKIAELLKSIVSEN